MRGSERAAKASSAVSIGVASESGPCEVANAAYEKVVEPQSIEEIAELVKKCEADKISLAPIGAARTLAQILRSPVQIGISLRRMARVVAYEPDDMTVVVESGISAGDLNATLAKSGQRLPVDPCGPEATTIGALVAAAHAGPLRLSEGTVRDLLIGIQFVGHGGRVVRAGGRVVKNVAGYDLMKMMTGSFGTLGIITEATFKVRPNPENYTLALAAFDRHDEAFSAASALHERIPLLHLEVTSPRASALLGLASRFSMLAGFAGIPSELAYQRDRIGRDFEMIEGERASAVYAALRDVNFDSATAARLAVLPNDLARCAHESSSEFVAHVGSGIAELYSNDAAPHAVTRWRAIAHTAGGHLRVLTAPAAIRNRIEFFDRPNPGALKLMQGLKASFDPPNIFNPGCFVGGL
jgi:glycolate oxidase FAD binding subunit